MTSGVTLPLMAQFCADEPTPADQPEQVEARKQDCKPHAFHRPAARLEEILSRLHVLIVADGLNANGPIRDVLPALQVGLHDRAQGR